MDEDVAAIVIDNGSDCDKDSYSSESKYAKVGADGIVTEIDSFVRPPSSEWKICKTNTKVGAPY